MHYMLLHDRTLEKCVSSWTSCFPCFMWCPPDVTYLCACVCYICVCTHWCGCTSLHMHVWRTDVYVKSFSLLLSFRFFLFLFPYEVGSPDWTWNSWFLLSWLTKKFQRFIYLCAPIIGIIYKHCYIWLFCLCWVYKLKNSCLCNRYFNPYRNPPSS